VITRAVHGRPGRFRDAAPVVFLAILLAVLPGCAPVPPSPGSRLLVGRGEIRPTDRAFLKEGVTTREEVLLRFGGPSMTLEGERVLTYLWVVEAAIMATMVYITYSVPSVNVLALEFDDNGLLRRQESMHKTYWFPWGIKLPTWLPAGIRTTGTMVVRVDLMAELRTRLGIPVGSTRPTAVVVAEFRDARPAPYTGTLFLRQGVGPLTVEIHNRRPVADLLRACVVRELEREGFTAAETPATGTLTGVVHVFQVEGGKVKLDVSLEAHSPDSVRALVRRYTLSFKGGKDGSGLLERAARGVLADFQRRLADDAELLAVLRGGSTGP
jgi:hypothetical protein